MKRALGVMMVVLAACGSGVDTPASSSGSPAEQDSKAVEVDIQGLRETVVWSSKSQPARDWDVDAAACKERADKERSVRKGAHPLRPVNIFLKCMEEMGWEAKSKNR